MIKLVAYGRDSGLFSGVFSFNVLILFISEFSKFPLKEKKSFDYPIWPYARKFINYKLSRDIQYLLTNTISLCLNT